MSIRETVLKRALSIVTDDVTNNWPKGPHCDGFLADMQEEMPTWGIPSLLLITAMYPIVKVIRCNKIPSKENNNGV